MCVKDLHGNGWTPRSDDRDAVNETTTPREPSGSSQAMQRPRWLLRRALMVLLAAVIMYASVRVVSDGATLVRRLQPHAAPTGAPHVWHNKIPNPSVLHLGPNFHVRPAQTTASLGISIGLALTAIVVTGFALRRLWKNRHVQRAPSRLRDRVRSRPPVGLFVLIGILALFVVLSTAGLVWSVVSGSHLGLGAPAMLGSPLILGAIVMTIRMWRREHRVLTGEFRGARLWCHDERGNSLPPVPLAFRAALKRFIADGDRVEVRGYWNKRRNVLQVQWVHNLTTCLKTKRFSLSTMLAIPALVMLAGSQLARTFVSPLYANSQQAVGLWMLIGSVGGLMFLVWVAFAVKTGEI